MAYLKLSRKIILVFTLLSIGCKVKQENFPESSNKSSAALSDKLFKILPAEVTKINFRNEITENPYGNILTYQYFYNGGGVAVGDINNDGLPDIYFSGNMSSNRLYLNKGNMVFEDITLKAGVAGRLNAWATGVTMADVDGDGLLDIYVCYSGNMPGEARMNELFINQGADANGNFHFSEQAVKYGLADSSFSTHAVFFDFDNDNDLDMFLLNHNPALFRNMDDASIKEILKHKEPDMRVKLFRNDNGRFTDISDRAGFEGSAYTYGLGVGVADVNNDGWQDIYISNDYSAPDYLYINNGNGTFTNKIQESVGHMPLYSMGNDIADYNNDGLPDILALDMLPEDNKRQKLLFAPDNYEHFELFKRVGFFYQYMRNMLYLNNGNGTFSEIGQLAGVSNTDWSWAPLFADFDNDGWKDLYITNGFLRDFTNMDFIKYRSSFFQSMGRALNNDHLLELVHKIPSSNINNYMFRNNGDLTFSNETTNWGLNFPSNSNGAVYADLDNDGDLDLIINNINQHASILRNDSEKILNNSFLKVKLKGLGKNTFGVGAKVDLFSGPNQQHLQQMPSRGYQSSVTPVLHFGLGQEQWIDSLRVIWPGGKYEVIYKVSANQTIELDENNASGKFIYPKSAAPVFEEIQPPFHFTHHKTNVNDFKRQPLLINPLSFSGPVLVKRDVNGDGLEDIYIGGAAGQSGVLYIQQKNGTFTQKHTPAFEEDKASEDASAVFFDANSDGIPDLYVASGGYGLIVFNDPVLQDRLYINDGKGNFTKKRDALPVLLSSAGCVAAADINGDGFQDLFVGGRVIPGRYPETPESFILINDGKGSFKDMTLEVASELSKMGMVTDAVFYDLNKDGKEELVLVGEWLPVTVFTNKDGKLFNDTKSYFNKPYHGWWNKITLGDFNKDGKADLIIGNMGLNSQVKASEKEPAELVYKDFDNNGSVDPLLCFYIQGKSYPYVTRDELLEQISMMRTRFPNYESYASARLESIFTAEELKNVEKLSANYLKTAYFQLDENNRFQEKPLPIEVQYSPVYAVQVLDYDNDGNQDLILSGNIYHARLRFGKYDANYGILLKGNEKGEFTYVPQHISGFKVTGDIRGMLEINNSVIFGINQKAVKAYKIKK